MNFYAIIPAREGAKRLPRKNKKILGGNPLIQWAIECAKEGNITLALSKLIFQHAL